MSATRPFSGAVRIAARRQGVPLKKTKDFERAVERVAAAACILHSLPESVVHPILRAQVMFGDLHPSRIEEPGLETVDLLLTSVRLWIEDPGHRKAYSRFRLIEGGAS